MIPLSGKDIISPYDESGKLNQKGEELFEKGVEILRQGRRLGAVILSGGEGTRLGLTYPKGLFQVEDATLFEWHLKRLQRLNELYGTPICLFIMTSDSTDDQVREFFSSKTFDFLESIDIFKQNSIEALDINTRKPIYRDGKAVRSPMGNGDFFKAIRNSPNMDKVDAFNVISVDNVLANILDEVFVGAFYSNNLEVLSKSVQAVKNESVGAFFKDGDHIRIEEYSEAKSGEDGCVYGNICNHLFSRDFVKKMGDRNLILHEARKKIPYTDGDGLLIKPTTPNGIKREMFIFDSFEHTTRNSVITVPRHLEFSPLKNSTESSSDNVLTCSKAIKDVRLKSCSCSLKLIH